jgi:hypothetical protein
MKRKWTEDTAVSYLLKNGFEKPTPHTMAGRCNGLKSCSAIDYLAKCFHYYFVFKAKRVD